jgi:hypothetical protein
MASMEINVPIPVEHSRRIFLPLSVNEVLHQLRGKPVLPLGKLL